MTASPLRIIVLLAALAAAGCKQKMGDQPYYKPYEPTSFFPDGRSNRPLEPGVIHRDQRDEEDPMVTGLTAEEWARAHKLSVIKPYLDAPVSATKDTTTAMGAPRFDPRNAGEPKVYTTELPFAMSTADLLRGQERYGIYCVACHGPLGNGKGKIVERGITPQWRPTSYHTQKVEEFEPPESAEMPGGYSRGYWRWGIQIPVREVPLGYIFEVITKGYGAMPSHGEMIPADDRWRITAYVRTLQTSFHATDPKSLELVRAKSDGAKPQTVGGGNH